MRSAWYLLDWSGEVVAEGRWSCSAPANKKVYGIPLRPKFRRVWVDVAKVLDAYLFCPSHELLTVEEVFGSTVAKPVEKVIARGNNLIFSISFAYHDCHS